MEAGYAARFTTLSQLAGALDGPATRGNRYGRLQRSIRPPSLIVAEIGYTRLTLEQAHQLFERVPARYERGAMLITSNVRCAEWGGLLGDDVLATDAMITLAVTGDGDQISEDSFGQHWRTAAFTAAWGDRNYIERTAYTVFAALVGLTGIEPPGAWAADWRDRLPAAALG